MPIFEGMKLRMMRENPMVCFEVEHFETLDNWESIVIQGRFEELQGGEAAAGRTLLVEHFRNLGAPSLELHQPLSGQVTRGYTNSIPQPMRCLSSTGSFQSNELVVSSGLDSQSNCQGDVPRWSMISHLRASSKASLGQHVGGDTLHPDQPSAPTLTVTKLDAGYRPSALVLVSHRGQRGGVCSVVSMVRINSLGVDSSPTMRKPRSTSTRSLVLTSRALLDMPTSSDRRFRRACLHDGPPQNF